MQAVEPVLPHMSQPAPFRGSLPIIAIIAAATSIGFAIHQHGGEYTPFALLLVTVALIASLAALVSSQKKNADIPRHRLVDVAIGVALTLQFFALFVLWPVGEDHKRQYLLLPNHSLYLGLIAAAGCATLLGFLDIQATRKTWFPLLLLLHSMLAFWTVRSSPLPHIDVWYFQEEGPRALLEGRNPYDASQVRFPDIYRSTHENHQRVYGEGMVVNDTLQFGFPYPPVSLYCSTLGVYLSGGKNSIGDARYAQAVALTLIGLLIGYCGPGRIPKLAAALLLFTPTIWFILGRAWTEPFVVLFLSATVFCACRNLRWILPVAFGLFLASKQYLALAVPLSFLLAPDFQWRSGARWRACLILLLQATAIAALVTLPLAIWNFHAFWFSLVTVQKEAPFRWDALSYLVWIAFHVDSKYANWTWLAFVAVVPAMGLTLWKARRGPAGFALGLALVYLVFIAFNKQAFCNYYFFVIGCLCCALAAMNTATIAESDKILSNSPAQG